MSVSPASDLGSAIAGDCPYCGQFCTPPGCPEYLADMAAFDARLPAWDPTVPGQEDAARETDPRDDFGLRVEDYFGPSSAEERSRHLESRVAATVERFRSDDAARRLLRREHELPTPSLIGLPEFLAQPDDATAFRLEGLWPVGGRVVFSAPAKSGKSTAVANLLRSLADGDPFLGRFDVSPPGGQIVLIDNELSEPHLRRWLDEQRIVNTPRITVASLRGRVSSFDLLDPEVRAEWATTLRAANASVVILDCLRPVLDALGLSEDKDAGRFLTAFDALLASALVGEALVVHHHGHQSERSRGDSRLQDWPDVAWKLVRTKAADGEVADPAGPRWFSAYGRDCDVPEGRLQYSAATRRLTLTGGSRRDSGLDHVKDAILLFLDANPWTSKNSIENAVGGGRADVRSALAQVIAAKQVDVSDGPRNAKLHAIAGTQRPTSPPRQILAGRSRDDLATSSLEARSLTESSAAATGVAKSDGGPDDPVALAPVLDLFPDRELDTS